MKQKIISSILFLGVMSILISSCVKEEFDMDTASTVNWDPNVAAPLINTSLTLWDILNDYDSTDLLVIDSNQFVYLVYEDTVFSETAESLIHITDQNMNFSDNLPLGVTTGDHVFDFDFNFDFNLSGGMTLDSILLKAGQLSFTMNSDLNYPATVQMTIPGSTLNGAPFAVTLNYNTSGNILPSH